MSDEEILEIKLKAFFSTFRDAEAGRIVLNDLMDKFYKKTFIPDTIPIDPYAIILNEGARSVVIYILSRIEEFEERGRKRQ